MSSARWGSPGRSTRSASSAEGARWMVERAGIARTISESPFDAPIGARNGRSPHGLARPGAHAAGRSIIYGTLVSPMADRKPNPQRLPDAVREAVDRTLQATRGSAETTRTRAQEAVDEIVRGAEAGAEAVR